MKPVHQTIVCPKRGDCLRACVASLFELEIEQVPHFILYEKKWYHMLTDFIWSLGYEYEGHFALNQYMQEKYSIGGYFIATVPSKTFTGGYHAVIIDSNGIVVHDPNPNGACLGLSIFENGTLIDKDTHWYIIKKRDSE